MNRGVPRRVMPLIAALTVLLPGCASTPTRQARSLTISEARGGGVSVVVSEALARQVLEGAIGTELDCRAELDPEFEAMLRTLDRRSRATLEDGDTTVRARRRGDSIRLDIRTRDRKGSIEAVMPWAFADCLLGRSTALADGTLPIRVKVTGEGGGAFEFAVR